MVPRSGSFISWQKNIKMLLLFAGLDCVECNAHFVTWSDGSLRLLIGNEAFDVSEQDGIFCAQGKLSRKLKFMPSSLSSSSHRLLTAQVNSQNRKVNKVKHCSTDVDPEWMMEQMQKAERQKTKANKKNKKVTSNYTSKGRKKRQLSSSFLEDRTDLEFGFKGKEDECSQSHRGIEEVHKGEAEEAFEDSEIVSEGAKSRRKESGGTLKKQYIESDEDSPPRRTTTRRRMAIMCSHYSFGTSKGLRDGEKRLSSTFKTI
ncbi:hypothetical protein Pfo_020576 [Paulownia fortunei]|nr:hypothetical protein Pfo_020576 [Paulownia fortunei]